MYIGAVDNLVERDRRDGEQPIGPRRPDALECASSRPAGDGFGPHFFRFRLEPDTPWPVGLKSWGHAAK
jgi:hypothetical protein